MSYQKTVWENGITPISVDKFNNIENGIETVDKTVSNLSNPNLLINGDFQIWQRGTNFSVKKGTNVYTCDRIMFANEGVVNDIYVSKVEEGLKFVVSSKEASYSNIRYYFEMDAIRKYIGKTLTFSTEYKSEWYDTWFDDVKIMASGGTIAVETLSTQKIELSDGWKKRIVTFKINSIDTSVTTLHLQLFRAKNDTIFGYHIIKYVKLEQGTVATPLTPKLYGEELLLCQRYYQNTFVGKVTMQIIAHALDKVAGFCPLNVPMRTTPTVRLKEGADLNTGVFGAYLGPIKFATFEHFAHQSSKEGIHIGFTSAEPMVHPNLSVGFGLEMIEADAEIY